MDNRRSSVCSSVMSGSTDVSTYNNNNNNKTTHNCEDVLKIERSADSPIRDSNGSKNYFLRWKGFEGNLISMVEGLKFVPGLSDVTVSCENGFKTHLHKLILASASLYFYQIFEEHLESKHPMIILSGIDSEILEMLISYMYCGFIDVPTEKLADLISAGRCLKIKGLMDMKENLNDNSMDIPMPSVLPQPPPAHISNSTSSFMMSPMSEPRMTPTFATSANSFHQHPPALMTLTGTWPGSDSLHLLATAAHMRSSSEEEERSSSAEPSPLPTSRGHSAISAVSAASAIAASRACTRRRQMPYFRYDRENEENDPSHGPSSSSDNSNHSISDLRAQDARAINLSIRSSEPLTPLNTNFSSVSPHNILAGQPPLLNIPNPSSFWPKREDLSVGFRPLATPPPATAATSSNDSSQNSSPLDFSNWRLNSDYSVQRLFGNSDAASNFSMSQLSRDNSAAAAVVESNRTALMAVAAAISAAAASAANERSLSVPPSAHSPSLISRRGPRHSRGPRRSTPSLSESHDSNLNHRKLNSPTNTGANWKSRQPTECDYCKRMFSNKFNLKQHILNMHSTGGEVRCEQCGKMVKNKWYLRRHKVTHHGAPLRKYKKENEFGARHIDSDNEEGDTGCHLVTQQ